MFAVDVVADLKVVVSRFDAVPLVNARQLENILKI